MILSINEFKTMLEFNSNYNYDMDMYNIYSNDQILLNYKKELNNLPKDKINRINSKNYFKELLFKINKVPLNYKIKFLNIFIICFFSTITLPEINKIIDESIEKKILVHNDASQIKNIISDMYKKEEIKKDVYKTPTEFSDTLVEFLKHEEGRNGKAVLTAYDIGDGMITIGYGHAERKKVTKMKAKVTKITEDEAEDLLIQDIMEAQRGVDRILRDWKKENIFIKITQNQYDAMISMTYNMGIGNIRKSDFLQLVKNGELEKAAIKIKTTNVTYPGHVTRRKKESYLFSHDSNIDLNKLLNI